MEGAGHEGIEVILENNNVGLSKDAGAADLGR